MRMESREFPPREELFDSVLFRRIEDLRRARCVSVRREAGGSRERKDIVWEKSWEWGCQQQRQRNGE